MADSSSQKPNSSSDGFVTPVKPMKKRRSLLIPASPFLKKLGCGTGVNVYLLERQETPRTKQAKSPWAVKKCSSRVNGPTRKRMQWRIEHEATILKSLSHENIIGYRSTMRDENGALCLCMEKGETSLRALIETRRESVNEPFGADAILKVTVAVSSALSYLHNHQNILHGDIKSDNILISGDFDQIKLCDFGVCIKLKSDLSGPANEDESYTGTDPWTASEILEEGYVTALADVYSLGCVVYEMLSLNIPHIPCLSESDEDSEDGDDDNKCHDESSNESGFLPTLGKTPEIPDMGFSPDHSPFIALMKICCRPVCSRPCAKTIVNTLRNLKEQMDKRAVETG